MSYKRGLAVVIGSVVAALVSYAATWPRFHRESAVGAATGVAASGPSVETALVTAFSPLPGHNDPYAWARLSDAQRAALAPFAPEWDQFSSERRRKWLRIAARYPKMSADAQKRLQARMTEWVRMTPEQRRVARENYQVSKELPAQARQRAWKDYQQLSPEQKARLAASERKRRTVVSAPPTSGKTEVHEIGRLVIERGHSERRGPQHAPAAASAPAAVSGVPGMSGASAPAAPSGASPANATSAAAAAVAAPPATVTPADTRDIFKGS